MGHKVHPIGFRLGIHRDWLSRWYDERHYTDLLQEDLKVRKAIQANYPEAGISRVEIERQANQVLVTIHTARPGIVIGRAGQRVDEMRQKLEKLTGKRLRLNIQEVRQPELDSYLVARSVADQMERRVAFRRAMRQAITRTMQGGAKGVKIICSGRLGGAEIARREMAKDGRVPLQTIRADIDFGFAEARTTLGRIGVKVWIYRGDILAPREEKPVAEAATPVAPAVPAPASPVPAAPAPVAPAPAAPAPSAPATA